MRSVVLTGLALALIARLTSAATIGIDPYPVQAGRQVTIQYDSTGRNLEGAAQVYLHYGFNGWNPVVSPDPSMSWSTAIGVWEVTVNVPLTAQQLDIVFHDESNN